MAQRWIVSDIHCLCGKRLKQSVVDKYGTDKRGNKRRPDCYECHQRIVRKNPKYADSARAFQYENRIGEAKDKELQSRKKKGRYHEQTK